MAELDFATALNMFSEGAQQAATTQAVNDAASKMFEINQQVATDAEQAGMQRKQLQDLSNGLALQLVGTGASAAHIQQAFNAVNPQSFGSAEQLQIEGALSGNQQYQQQAGQIINQRQQMKQNEMTFENKLQQSLIDKKFQNDLIMEQLKMAKSNPEIKPEELAFQTNIKVANNLIDDLSKVVQDKGTYESAGPFSSPEAIEASAKLDSIPYQLAITYAKIVDPASVAREGEVAAAQKYLINTGLTAVDNKVISQLEHMKKTIQDYSSSRLSTQQQTGSPTAKKLTATSPIQQNGTIEVRQLKDGTRVKVMRTPDGRYLKVD